MEAPSGRNIACGLGISEARYSLNVFSASCATERLDGKVSIEGAFPKLLRAEPDLQCIASPSLGQLATSQSSHRCGQKQSLELHLTTVRLCRRGCDTLGGMTMCVLGGAEPRATARGALVA